MAQRAGSSSPNTRGAPVAKMRAALGDRVDFVEVAFTTDQLEAAAAALLPLLGAEVEAAPVEIAVDIQGNGIAISATDRARPEIERLLAVVSTAVPVPIRSAVAATPTRAG